MKRILLATLLIGVTLFSTSCKKFLVDVDVNVKPALTGKWYLQDAARYDGYRWQGITTGYEGGTFSFYSNGDVTYIDSYGSLRGRWEMYSATSGYYDGNGHYSEGYHSIFNLRLYDGSIQEVNWSFDDNNFQGGNRFKATYYDAGYQYQYTFVRE
jgi:hypothetical protein